jgi:hypothetical protein
MVIDRNATAGYASEAPLPYYTTYSPWPNFGYGPGFAAGPGSYGYAQSPGWPLGGQLSGGPSYPRYGQAPGAGAGCHPGSYPNPASVYGWVPTTDDEIQYWVENALNNDPRIPNNANIEVSVDRGVVTLTGSVPTKQIKHAAGDDAWWLPPVLDVHPELTVRRRHPGRGESSAKAAGPAGRSSGRHH